MTNEVYESLQDYQAGIDVANKDWVSRIQKRIDETNQEIELIGKEGDSVLLAQNKAVKIVLEGLKNDI